MIIGLTGPNASGKGEAALYIKSKGFGMVSLSDIIREEAKKRGIEPIRENLIKLGNTLRKEKGPHYLAVQARQRLIEDKDYIIDSIRSPFEVEELRNLKGFVLIGIDAPVETRFKRSIERKRQGDAANLKDFIEKEEKENKSASSNQQLVKCLKMADIIITNDSSLEDFHRKIDEAIKTNKKA